MLRVLGSLPNQLRLGLLEHMLLISFKLKYGSITYSNTMIFKRGALIVFTSLFYYVKPENIYSPFI
jgi:hypothetical protein